MFIQINNFVFNKNYLVHIGDISQPLHSGGLCSFYIGLTDNNGRYIYGTQSELESIRAKLLTKICPKIIKP